jgi:hypothetical protein
MVSIEMLDWTSLAPGSLIDVETKSRHYLIECLGGNQVRISGHPDYCPQPVPALLQGSVDREGTFERGFLGRGMRMMFVVAEHRPVTTSRVLSLRVERANAMADAVAGVY